MKLDIGLCLVLVLSSCSSSPLTSDQVVLSSEPTVAPSASGCAPIGCVSGLRLTFDTQDLAAGTWTLELSADGKRATCTVTLPASCDAPEPCSGDFVVLMPVPHCKDAPRTQRLQWLQVPAAPDHLEIVAKLDGNVVANEVLTPSYRTYSGGGPSCEPVCRQDALRVVFGGKRR